MKRLIGLFGLAAALLLAGAVSAQEAGPAPQDLAHADGAFVDVGGASIYYRVRGPEDAPVVLLLHGFLGSTEDWNDTLDILETAGFRVVAFDRPPFGLSDKNPDLEYTLGAQAAVTAGLMDALGIETASLVGHSAGGGVVARFAVDYPERVEKLVFVAGLVVVLGDDTVEGAPGAFSFLGNADPRNPLAQAALRGFFTSQFARDMADQSFANPDRIPAEMLERTPLMFQLRGWEAGLLAFTRDSGESALDEAALAVVEAPALLMWGEQDRIVPLAIGERLHGILPNNTLLVYPDTGHVPMIEAGQAFFDDMLAFLGG